MKKVKWFISLGLVGCIIEDEFEVEDDTTEEEIEELAGEVAFSVIDWGWEVE